MQIFIILFFLFLGACTPQNRTDEDTVVTYLDGNIPHLDAIHSMNRFSSMINASIFEGLYHYHYLKRPIVVEPLLASSMPQVSKDGMTYTIKIKKGVFFQDDPSFPGGKGRELVAEDFIYSWKRLADPKNKALGWWVLDGVIEGLNTWRDQLRNGKASYNTKVSGLQALDSHTLVIRLTRPSFQFLHFLSIPVTAAMSREVVEYYGKDIINHPIGTGPYKLVKWVRNSEVRLKKNPTFRTDLYPFDGAIDSKEKGLLKYSGKKLPLSTNIIVKILRERQPEWLAFQKGQIDHGVVPNENNEQVFHNGELTENFKKKGVRILYLERPDLTYIGFNMEHPVLGKHKKLRKAMAMAMDKNLVINKFYNRRGIAAQSPIPPHFDGYNPNYKSPLQYNILKAKKLLTEAGFPNGQGLPIFQFELTNSGPWERQLAEFFKNQFAKIGVKIKVVANTWPQFDKKVKNKQATIFHGAWIADYPDTDNFLQLFYSRNISPGSNGFNFVNRDYDKLYEASTKIPPGKERNKLIKKMIAFINEEVPAIFMLHRTFKLPYHGWLENYNEFPIIYDYYKYLKVDKKKKEQLIKSL